MRIVTGILTALSAIALAGFAYQQIVVEGGLGPAAMVGTAVLGLLVVVNAALFYLAGTRHRETVVNVFVALCATVVTYFVADLAAGWLLIVPLSPPLVPDAYRHHALVPDSHAELRQRDFAYIQRVNTLGLRGRETTVEKPPGTRRILMLGDSFTMGKGVQENETFAVLTEELLSKRLSACTNVEVLNGGVDSYAPILSLLQLRRDLAKLQPDLVVLNLDHSDLIQEQAYRSQAVRDEGGRIVAVPQIWQDSLYEQFLSWSSRRLFFTRALLVYANRAMAHREISVRRVVNEAGREHFAHTLEGDVDRTRQWDDIFESLEAIHALAGSMGAQFILSTYPWAHQLGEHDWVPGRYDFMSQGERTSDLTERTIRERAAALNMTLFEALPVFMKHRSTTGLYFPHDPHWTPAGHQIMAEGLAGFIADHQAWCPATTIPVSAAGTTDPKVPAR